VTLKKKNREFGPQNYPLMTKKLYRGFSSFLVVLEIK